MATRLLLPSLPPELRALIYTQTIPASNPAITTGLSFTKKIYDSSHTRVEIAPSHRGNPGLLALQGYRYLEGDEYAKWVLTNAVQLRITVVFKGHVNTFVQEHWDKKISTHLKNLAKKYPWLRKVTDYDVRIVWRPSTWVLSKKGRKVGAIAKRMVEVLTREMDGDVKLRRGDVKAGLYVADWVVGGYGVSGQVLGLGEFIWEVDGGFARTQVREVGVVVDAREIHGAEDTDGYVPSHFRAISATTGTKKPDALEQWNKSVCRREVRSDQNEDVIFEVEGEGEEGGEASTQQAMLAIAKEISGFRQTRTRIETQR